VNELLVHELVDALAFPDSCQRPATLCRVHS
jgi:hypothetical protein